MLTLFTKLFDSNEKEIKRLAPIIGEINSLEEDVKKLKDSDFPKKTKEFRERVANGESIFLLLPEAFALVREAARRTLGQRHYDVQLMAATVLAQGKVAEQKTGEGKTLSAVPALYLHSLTGKSVHLVTVNDYLARRDAAWMGTVFNFLGVSVSSIINDQSFIFDPEYVDESARDYRLIHLKSTTRAEAYKQDVVYGINSEFGFDYLRDNMVQNKELLVQTGYYFAVIDEVDSVLIDEARTPHIVSMPDETPSRKYYEYADIVKKLNSSGDFSVDEKYRTAHLTEHGLAKVEKLYGIKDIYEKDFDTVYHIEAALKAQTLFHADKDYIVRDGQVILVDEFTGRLMEGRRLSDGLHQAIEAKEGVAIQQESKILATVSLQNYFRMYERLAGMTGTAVTEAEEFHKIYKLDVVVIPTNKPQLRIDQSDAIYKTIPAKVSAVVREIEAAYKNGQPVLVGTTSIDKNEIISEFLKRKKIPHEVLNAKNHVKEAMIIKDAGRKGAVTVATNMAGRGVDIILGGEPPSRFEVEYQTADGKKKYEEENKKWEKQHAEVVEKGGLLVIGTEKHDSRRIDNQLRGRSGRQGDPGRSVFILSLEDDLMRIFGGEQIAGIMTRFNFPEDQPLSHGLVTRVIEQAQVKVEGFNFEARKHTVEYDDVLNKQREIIYGLRRRLLVDEENAYEYISEKVRETIKRIVEVNLSYEGQQETAEGENLRGKIIEEFVTILPFDEHSRGHLVKQLEQFKTTEEITEFLYKLVEQIRREQVKKYGEENINRVLKSVILQSIDLSWMEHLTAIEDLRTGIGLRGYAQRDPIVEYKNEAFGMFERLMTNIDDAIVTRAFKIPLDGFLAPSQSPKLKDVEINQPASEVSSIKTNGKKESAKEEKKKKTVDSGKLGRNDPCWCGSGKKWKKCHWPNLKQTPSN